MSPISKVETEPTAIALQLRPAARSLPASTPKSHQTPKVITMYPGQTFEAP